MVNVKIENILNDKKLPVGKKLILEGEFRRGVPADEIKKVENEFSKIRSWYLDEIVLIDFTNLLELDSIGIRNTFPLIFKYNQELRTKGRVLISILGNKKSDIFNAIRDKFPNETSEILPWYETEDEFRKFADIG